MGLAPYGEPRYAAVIRDKLIEIKDDGASVQQVTEEVVLRMTRAAVRETGGRGLGRAGRA